jgi:hypothetical protein
MRDFGGKTWATAGARPHVLLRGFDGLEARVDALATRCLDLIAEDVADGVVRVLPRESRHLTLAWVDVSLAANERLLRGFWSPHSEARTYLGHVGEVTLPPYLVIRSAAVTTHDVRLRVDATAELDELADMSVEALRKAYGDDAPIHRARHPHITLAYGIKDTPRLPEGPLAGEVFAELDPVVATGELTFTGMDTFATDGPVFTTDPRESYIGQGALWRVRDGFESATDYVPYPPRYTPHDRSLSPVSI